MHNNKTAWVVSAITLIFSATAHAGGPAYFQSKLASESRTQRATAETIKGVQEFSTALSKVARIQHGVSCSIVDRGGEGVVRDVDGNLANAKQTVENGGTFTQIRTREDGLADGPVALEWSAKTDVSDTGIAVTLTASIDGITVAEEVATLDLDQTGEQSAEQRTVNLELDGQVFKIMTCQVSSVKMDIDFAKLAEAMNGISDSYNKVADAMSKPSSDEIIAEALRKTIAEMERRPAEFSDSIFRKGSVIEVYKYESKSLRRHISPEDIQRILEDVKDFKGIQPILEDMKYYKGFHYDMNY